MEQNLFTNKKLKNMKKMYRIELTRSHGIAQEIAILAALSNGGNYISLVDIDAVARTECKRFPSINEGISVNLIGDHNLTIDKGTENLLSLEEVDIFELVEEEAPTLNRQTSLLDETNSELLN